MSGNRRAAMVLLLITLIPSAVHGQDMSLKDRDPSWVYYEKGLYEYSRRNYGQALYLFKEALSGGTLFPEAEFAIGNIYYDQGEYALAENQFNRALDQRALFQEPGTAYLVLYKLSLMYYNSRKFFQVEATLKRITGENPRYAGPENAAFRERVLKVFVDKGFDVMLTLYRMDQSFAAGAHSELAWFYYRTRRFDEAFEHALFGLIPVVSQAMVEIRREIPDYRYTTLQDFLRTAAGLETVKTWLFNTNIFKHLYYLAAISFAQRQYDRSTELWTIVAKEPLAGEYAVRSQNQLDNPGLEPLLDVRGNR